MGALVEREASSWVWVAPPPCPLLAWESGKEVWEALVLQAEKPEVRLRTQREEGVSQECFPFPGGHPTAGAALPGFLAWCQHRAGHTFSQVTFGLSTELQPGPPPPPLPVQFPRRSHRVTWPAPRCPLGWCCG